MDRDEGQQLQNRVFVCKREGLKWNGEITGMTLSTQSQQSRVIQSGERGAQLGPKVVGQGLLGAVT